MIFNCRVLRTEKSWEYGWFRVEAADADEARATLEEHLRENDTAEDMDGDLVDWSFVDGETLDWEIGDIEPAHEE